ncbi:MAG: hypothetical protein ACRDDX_14255 [Cellulosilyticaceae bacterium]
MDKNRWRNYGLWVSIAAFIPLLLSSFGIHIIPNYQTVVNAFLSILVVAGIISNPTTANLWFGDDTTKDDTPSKDSTK